MTAVAFAVSISVLAAGLFISATPVYAQAASVHRVVDGDTVDVVIDDETVRIRLLNYDAPEYNATTGESDCLGQAASDRLSELLQPDENVTLLFDRGRQDRFGRTLARIVREDGTDVADRIIREGLGLPVEVGENTRFSASAREAAVSAESNRLGLFSEAVDCSPAAIIAAVDDPPSSPAPQNGSASEAVAYLAALEAQGALFDEAQSALAALDFLPPAYLDLFSARLSDRVALHQSRVLDAEAIVADAQAHEAAALLEAEAQAAADQALRDQEAEAARVAAEEREAREPAAASRPPASGGSSTPPPPSAAAPQPVPAPAPPPAATPGYPSDAGYTGCRNYNGVGMVDSQGRSFEPIPCP